ncbi:hypothetical protein A3H89_02905 [Candidatus Amesbacteria bacterium RIFCSPLOWO2_02_FULL_48_11]|uniref:Uncharacterized protein n=3 Tax=Candidatus Amesiibacteriota TaxID=1752730 RepID=A0A1F5A1U3_9BACT|nr:MAG: hypothetical protein UX78_C0002G0106 [Candidatus Amesbacteria bacterium GW2011_GWA2_47_11]KKW01063.1 MAG: hypothetical protein UY33_C0002G0053 [Candidatus Amesbacteria bacterium GW2011_GWA1_48_9]OGC89641.1 MAG: hypothetical protein A2V48_02915 [Candidatus Amesbacteria bacterium RBG_19FT_COMBO_48_16]OGC96959.1 MAG: hypothetical protein A3C34_03950 [Candidatus Amesbacteria bacterium RIFCSPHIGHO2_02_FULL_48_21]OGC97358.1 MAG: hypothetical protein A2W16_02970 [Candidatus Amesbacteria bacter
MTEQTVTEYLSDLQRIKDCLTGDPKQDILVSTALGVLASNVKLTYASTDDLTVGEAERVLDEIRKAISPQKSAPQILR